MAHSAATWPVTCPVPDGRSDRPNLTLSHLSLSQGLGRQKLLSQSRKDDFRICLLYFPNPTINQFLGRVAIKKEFL